MKKVYSLIAIISTIVLLSSCGNDENAKETAFSKIENMAQLGTVEYTISKLIIADDDAFYTFGDRKVIFSCKATLKAGIDIKDFTKDDIVIHDNAVTVNLPEPTILSMNMPIEDIKCEYMKVDILRQDFDTDDRNQLLVQGEESIRADIASYGIIDKAKENATIFFESLLNQVGFENVNVVFTSIVQKEK